MNKRHDFILPLLISLALTAVLVGAAIIGDRSMCGNIGGDWQMDWTPLPVSHCWKPII